MIGGVHFYAGFEILREDDRLVVPEHHDLVFDMPADRAREHGAFGVPSFANHVGERITVRDAYDVLLDDGTLVEDTRDIVAGGADELDAPLVRPVVWPRADESGQKRVVDVNHPVRVSVDKSIAE